MVGAAGLTLVAPAAYYTVTGHLNGAAWSVWIANLVFAANQIQFVQLRIHAARTVKPNRKLSIGRGLLCGQIVLMVLLALACADHLFRWYAAIAFLPILSRVSPSSSGHLNRSRFMPGRRELIHASAFAFLLVVGFQLP